MTDHRIGKEEMLDWLDGELELNTATEIDRIHDAIRALIESSGEAGGQNPAPPPVATSWMRLLRALWR